MAAKPIIDILIEVVSLNSLDELTPVMESIGYEAKGEFGISGRRYFTKGGSNRSHQIRAFISGDRNIVRHIAFRDYLKSHPIVLQEYEALKKKLARECNDNIDIYCNGKDEFIKYHEIKAVEWIQAHIKTNKHDGLSTTIDHNRHVQDFTERLKKS